MQRKPGGPTESRSSAMDDAPQPPAVSRLFPFVVRSKAAVPGGDNVTRLRKKMALVLVAAELSPAGLDKIRSNCGGVPLFQIYTMAQLEAFFGFRNAKVIGLKKGALAGSILRELRAAG